MSSEMHDQCISIEKKSDDYTEESIYMLSERTNDANEGDQNEIATVKKEMETLKNENNENKHPNTSELQIEKDYVRNEHAAAGSGIKLASEPSITSLDDLESSIVSIVAGSAEVVDDAPESKTDESPIEVHAETQKIFIPQIDGNTPVNSVETSGDKTECIEIESKVPEFSDAMVKNKVVSLANDPIIDDSECVPVSEETTLTQNKKQDSPEVGTIDFSLEELDESSIVNKDEHGSASNADKCPSVESNTPLGTEIANAVAETSEPLEDTSISGNEKLAHPHLSSEPDEVEVGCAFSSSARETRRLLRARRPAAAAHADAVDAAVAKYLAEASTAPTLNCAPVPPTDIEISSTKEASTDCVDDKAVALVAESNLLNITESTTDTDKLSATGATLAEDITSTSAHETNAEDLTIIPSENKKNLESIEKPVESSIHNEDLCTEEIEKDTGSGISKIHEEIPLNEKVPNENDKLIPPPDGNELEVESEIPKDASEACTAAEPVVETNELLAKADPIADDSECVSAPEGPTLTPNKKQDSPEVGTIDFSLEELDESSIVKDEEAKDEHGSASNADKFPSVESNTPLGTEIANAVAETSEPLEDTSISGNEKLAHPHLSSEPDEVEVGCAFSSSARETRRLLRARRPAAAAHADAVDAAVAKYLAEASTAPTLNCAPVPPTDVEISSTKEASTDCVNDKA
eukprot:CAMPEP_0194346510 /NCGR_PEP_ID=MMETSP0171-20130528/105464_1 /TAXON_ID=218684 /ORGANISM="Corethron pennatum, Strain L29A3" /LENGTH=694 /DNA_ID=CAMNT_0039113641 /DNA_START=263 /DNA_END=2343 /DNA_ORIENTATION=-